jgi:tetratricopeptide (TPR) repeat protein
LVSGWHFGRVWYHFGTPIIGSFDVESGFRWWQDPGYNTSAYFLRFGRSLVEPFFSEFNGLADGLYSTLWGDALWGGVAERRGRPPWNYDLMAAGYLLALVPTFALIVGAVAAVVEFVRRPMPEWGILIGLACLMVLAFLFHFLRLPYACHVKAFYALPAILALAAFAGLGFDLLTLKSVGGRALWGLLLGTWALTSLATYWVVADSPAAETWIGNQLLGKRTFPQAAEHFQTALRLDPNYVPAHVALGNLLGALKQPLEARQHFEQALKVDPADTNVQIGLARVLSEQGQVTEAISHARRAVEDEPDNLSARRLLGQLFDKQGMTRDAITAFRHALGIAPADSQTHFFLGMILADRGALEEAVAHGRMAVQWQPDLWPAVNWLARLLATNRDPKIRNGAEAVRLVGPACEATAWMEPILLDTLAAALAETGRFDEAARVQERAVRIASQRTPATAADYRKHLELYQDKKPLREHPRRS